MPEVFANEFVAALAGSLNDNDPTFDLTVAPPAALALGTWRLRIGLDPETNPGAPYELCLVDGTLTAGVTVTVTRGIEGTTAAAWSDATPVAAVLTAAGLLAAGTIISATDPGAVGAGRLWLQAHDSDGDIGYALYVRDDTDTSWLPATSFLPGSAIGAVHIGDQGELIFDGVGDIFFQGFDSSIRFFERDSRIRFTHGESIGAGVLFDGGGSLMGAAGNPATSPAANSLVTFLFQGSPTAGSATFGSGVLNGSDPVPWNADAATVQTAFETAVGVGQVLVTDGPLPDNNVTVEFIGTLAQQSIVITATLNDLTGGTAPAPLITQLVFGKVLGVDDRVGAVWLSDDGHQYRHASSDPVDWVVIGGGLTPATYTIANDTTLRTIDVATATPTQMLNFMCTVVRDLGGA